MPEIAQDLFCQRCGYNLRGLTGNRCPECGASLDGVRSLVSQIPWVYRKELGWWRAYWQTVWFVMFRQARFCDEMARPVSFLDSQRFRCVTIAMVFISVVLADILQWVTGTPSPFNEPFLDTVWNSVFGAAILHLCFILYLVAATGVPSYFFHPKGIPIEQQSRAIALSYYACGQLVFLVIPVLTCAAAILTSDVKLEVIPMLLTVVSMTFPIAAVAPWWLDLIHLARRLVPQKPGRAVALAVYVPLLWLLLAAFILVGLPLLVFYVVIIFASLR